MLKNQFQLGRSAISRLLLISLLLCLAFALPSKITAEPASDSKETSSDTFIPKSHPLTLTTEEQRWLKDHPDIRLGVESNWPPYEFINEAGQLQGLSADVLRRVEQRLGITFKVISQYAWADTLRKVKSKDIDLISSVVRSPDREAYLEFTQAYYSPPIAIYTRKDSVTVNRLSNLKNKTIAVENQYYTHTQIASRYPEIKLRLVESTADALRALSYGEVDAYVGDQGAGNWISEQYTLNNLNLKPETELGQAPLRLAVREDWSVFQGILNKALATISDAEMSEIRRKWLGTDRDIAKLNISVSEQLWLDQHKAIRFTGDPNWLPYEAFDKQGNYIGIVSEYLELIEQKLGIDVTRVPTKSWNESLELVKRGEIDILSETSDSDLSSLLTFTQPYLSSPVVIVMRSDQNYVENIDQIRQRKIAMIKGYGYVPEINRNYPDLDVLNVENIQDGLTAVSTGKVDVLFATLAQVSYQMSELGINNIRIVGKTEFNTSLAFGMQAEFAPLVPLFDRALDSISQSEKQRIFDQWGKQEFATKIDYKLIARIAALFFLILAAIAYWNRRLRKEIIRRKELEAQTQALIENIPLQILVLSPDGDILLANPKALADYQIKAEELDLHNMRDFYADLSDAIEVKNELAEKGRIDRKIIPFRNPDGTDHSMMVSVMPLTYRKRKALLAIAIDMTERLEMENALKEAMVSSEIANKAKSTFLANMSHEIRTPMNAIIGFTELLNDQVKEPKLKSFVKTIQSAGKNLLTLINDILDLSKIEAGKLRIELKACNPHELLSEVSNMFVLQMRQNDLYFILDIDPEIPQSLILDATRSRQVMFNLIGNAVKFTEKGHIKITARALNVDKVRNKIDLLIDIEDSGIGIAEDQIDVIFEQFEQSQGQSTQQYAGTGLGLAISRRLIEMMGGTLSVTSTLGKGSVFSISLKGINVTSEKTETNKSQDTDHSVIKFYPAKILVVDDVEDNRKLLLANFEDTEFSVFEATNGLEALALAKEQAFDLILMDIRMPVMDGYQAAQEIKSTSGVPIVALTASVMTDQFEQSKSDNFDGYLRKPALKSELVNELAKFLPFEEIIDADTHSQDIVLNDAEIGRLPDVLLSLRELSEEFNGIETNNNIEYIRKFSAALEGIEQQNPVSVVNQYQQNLQNQIESFDIAGIKRSLEGFEGLVKQLEQLLDK